jgi:hypothetical protein
MSAEPRRGYRRSPDDVDRDSVAGAGGTVVPDGAVEGAVVGDTPGALDDGVGGGGTALVVGIVESLQRRDATATGSSGAAHAASNRVPATATTVSDRNECDDGESERGTAARYRTYERHWPRQIDLKTCKVCSRSSSVQVAAPMTPV